MSDYTVVVAREYDYEGYRAEVCYIIRGARDRIHARNVAAESYKVADEAGDYYSPDSYAVVAIFEGAHEALNIENREVAIGYVNEKEAE